MNSEKLMNAMSGISDIYLEEAYAERAGNNIVAKREAKRKKIDRIGGIAAAASLVALILGISVPLIIKNSDGNLYNGGSIPDGSPSSPGDATSPGTIYGVGSIRYGQHGSVKFASMTDTTATFEFDITSDLGYENNDITVICFKFTEENQMPKVCMITTSDYDYGIERLPIELLKLTVNGDKQPQYKMPNTVGHYEVVFDYSEVYNNYEKIRVDNISFTSLQEIWYDYQFSLIDFNKESMS